MKIVLPPGDHYRLTIMAKLMAVHPRDPELVKEARNLLPRLRTLPARAIGEILLTTPATWVKRRYAAPFVAHAKHLLSRFRSSGRRHIVPRHLHVFLERV